MSAGFFTGISEGFFNARRESEMQTRQQDEKRRQETIGVLSNLMEQADPRSRNILLGQIGEVMGLRGKERNFWDTLTGKAQFDLQDQLQQKLKDVLGMVKGPEEYERMQQMATGPDLTGMFNDRPSPVRQAREQLPRTIGLRDPRAEKMQDFELQRRLIQEQQTARDRERAESRKDELQYRAQLKQQQEEQALTTRVMQRAGLLAYRRLIESNPELVGSISPTEINPSFINNDDLQLATTQILDAMNVDEQTKAARLKYVKAATEGLVGGEAALDVDTLRVTAPSGKVVTKAGVATALGAKRVQVQFQRLNLERQRLVQQGKREQATRLQTMGGAFAKARTAYEQAAAPLVKGLQERAPALQAQMTPEGISIMRDGKRVPLTEADLSGAAKFLLMQEMQKYQRVLPQLAGARQTMKDNFPKQLEAMEQD